MNGLWFDDLQAYQSVTLEPVLRSARLQSLPRPWPEVVSNSHLRMETATYDMSLPKPVTSVDLGPKRVRNVLE